MTEVDILVEQDSDSSPSEASEALGKVPRKRKRSYDKPESSQVYLDRYKTQYKMITESQKGPGFCFLHDVFRAYKNCSYSN